MDHAIAHDQETIIPGLGHIQVDSSSMQTKTKMVSLELIGGLFGWVWIIASLAFAYFLIAAIFFHGPWSRVGWAFGAGAVAKWLARGFNDHKARVAFMADHMANGYSAEAARAEWYAGYTGAKAATKRPSIPTSTADSSDVR
jgi:hypothetical protein